MRYYLALIQRPERLTAVILRASLAPPRFVALFERETGAGEMSESVLQALKSDCDAAGYGAAWSNGAVVCLSAENAIFHDFMLPTDKAGMAKKTIPLLLESEFPFDAGEFISDTRFFRYGNEKRLGALVTLLPRKILEDWRIALESCGLPGAKLFVSPWPLIASLGKRGKDALLICLSDSTGTICALDSGGCPMRIQVFALRRFSDPEDFAAELFRKCGLLLAGLQFKARALLLHASGLAEGAVMAVGKGFDLPVSFVEDDVSKSGKLSLSRARESVWKQAAAMFVPGLLRNIRIPVFVLGMKKNAFHKGRRLILAGGAVLALFLAMGAVSFLDSLEYRSKAAILRARLVDRLKEALPESPRNAGLGKLRAILNSGLGRLEQGGNGRSRQAVLELMENIHAAVPSSLDIDVHRFAIDGKHVRIYGHAGSYDDVNAMKESLENIKGTMGSRIANAAARAGRDRNSRALVEFELDLPRTPLP